MRWFLIVLIFALFAGSCSATAEQSQVEILSTKPYIEGNNLVIEIVFMNRSSVDGNVFFDATYNNKNEIVMETIPKESGRIYRYTIMNLQPGLVRLAVLGDQNLFIEINVPADFQTSNSITMRELSAAEWYGGTGTDKDTGQNGNLFFLGPDFIDQMIGGAIVILAFSAVMLALKIALRKKSKKELEMQSMEKMVKESEEIKTVKAAREGKRK